MAPVARISGLYQRASHASRQPPLSVNVSETPRNRSRSGAVGKNLPRLSESPCGRREGYRGAVGGRCAYSKSARLQSTGLRQMTTDANADCGNGSGPVTDADAIAPPQLSQPPSSRGGPSAPCGRAARGAAACGRTMGPRQPSEQLCQRCAPGDFGSIGGNPEVADALPIRSWSAARVRP